MVPEISSTAVADSKAEKSPSHQPSADGSSSDFPSLLHFFFPNSLTGTNKGGRGSLGEGDQTPGFINQPIGVVLPLLTGPSPEGQAESIGPVLQGLAYEEGKGETALLKLTVPHLSIPGEGSSGLQDLTANSGAIPEGKGASAESAQAALAYASASGALPEGKGASAESAQVALPYASAYEKGNSETELLKLTVPFLSTSGEKGTAVPGRVEATLSSEEFHVLQNIPKGSSDLPKGISTTVESIPLTKLAVSAGTDRSLSHSTSENLSGQDQTNITPNKSGREGNPEGFSHFSPDTNGSEHGTVNTAGSSLLGSQFSLHLRQKGALSPLNEQLHQIGIRSLGEGPMAQSLPLISEGSMLNFHSSPEVGHSAIMRVAGEIVSNLQQNRHEAVFQLEPPELGKVKIDLILQGDQVNARVVAEVADAKALIQGHLAELRQALQTHNIELGEVRVDVGDWDEETGDLSEDSRQESKEPGSSRDDSVVFGEAEEEQGETGEPARNNHASGVSVWA